MEPLRINTLLAAIKKEVAAYPNKRELARNSGLHENTILAVSSANWNPSAETLRRIEAVIYDGKKPRRKRSAN
jgi:DNA-binding phage protein